MTTKIRNNRLGNPTIVAASVAVALLGGTQNALAQPQNKGEGIEQIIVTSQKRVKNLEEVPVSVAAMNEKAIEQTGLRELQEMDEYIPNLQMSKGSSYKTNITIRGVGSSSRNIGFDSRVGVYVDGVYMGQSPATNQDILDVERIEVLRGPQGTLFGKNTVAGAISMITKAPDEEFSGKVKVDIGNYASRRIAASVNVPLSDSTFAKLSVNKQTRDGYVDNLPTSSSIGEQDSLSYRLQLKSILTDRVDINIALDGMDTERAPYTGSAFASPLGTLTPTTDQYTAINEFEPIEDRELKGGAVTVDWDLLNGGMVKSISALRDTYSRYQGDLDAGISYVAGMLPGTPVTVGFAFGINGNAELDYTDEYRQLSQEFQYISPSEGELQYVLGLYFYDQKGESTRNAVGHRDPTHPFYTSGTLEYPGDDFDVLNTHGVVDTRTYAAYVNGTYDLTEKWTLGFGARYSHEKKTVDWMSDTSDSASDVLGVGVTLNAAFNFYNGDYQDERTDKHFSPEVSLLYALNDETNFYYRASSGYKSGGFNVDFITTSQFALGLEFDKETVVSHEVGVKGSAFGRNLTYTASVFSANYDDYQVQQFLENSGSVAGAAVIGNASEVDTKGLEIELVAQLSDNFRVTSSFGLLDAEFVSFPGGGTDQDGNVIDLSGARLAGAPDTTFNIGGQYYFPIDAIDAELRFRVDYSYTGDRYIDSNNQEEKTRTLANGDVISFGYVDSVSNVNARVSLMSYDYTWEVSLWGRNLTDEYSPYVDRNIFGSYLRFDSIPRTYGVELVYNF
ncbi:MAG TPA: TonB-dependent receptor [Alteromonas macleodii]|nr:TonB-dependent receptor [Alteromonas macleodii]HBA58382.1 TonB-dependent receptor [Alteromonas macleodii]|tara:strand:+ start:18567 stop:20933 length:2367 start_codon:yes stop_codon:yes gene_type:complete